MIHMYSCVACLLFIILVNANKDEAEMNMFEEIDKLKAYQKASSAQIAALQERNAYLEQRVAAFELKQHEEDINKQHLNCLNNGSAPSSEQHKIDQKENYTSKRQIVDRVAFTAGVSANNLQNLGIHHTIVFDQAITNIGNAYHPNSGIFLAPVKGAYVFTLTMMSANYKREYLEIVLDGVAISDIVADASTVDGVISTTKQWVLEVNQGSEVWVRTSSYQHSGEIHGSLHTLFTGFLLFNT